jgi:hypothetical protein
MLIVRLVRPPKLNDFLDGYFPRKFRLKSEAEILATEVTAKGGEAVIEKE